MTWPPGSRRSRSSSSTVSPADDQDRTGSRRRGGRASGVAPSELSRVRWPHDVGEVRDTLAQHAATCSSRGRAAHRASRRALLSWTLLRTLMRNGLDRPDTCDRRRPVFRRRRARPRRGAVLVHAIICCWRSTRSPSRASPTDPRPAASEPGDLVGALLGRLERPGFVHRARRRRVARRRHRRGPPSSPSAARRTASVVFDGRSFAYTLSGTQVQTIGLLGGLVRAGADDHGRADGGAPRDGSHRARRARRRDAVCRAFPRRPRRALPQAPPVLVVARPRGVALDGGPRRTHAARHDPGAHARVPSQP